MISVIGSINTDLIASTSRFPDPGETVLGSSFVIRAGGKGANQALAACRSGSMVRLVGAIGNDTLGLSTLSLLTAANVDLSGVRRVSSPTGSAIILVDPSGENMITIVSGANAEVNENDAAAGLRRLTPSDIVLLQMELPPETIDAALQLSRMTGATSILNTAPFTPDTAALVGQADIVVSNETEFQLLAGERLQGIPKRHRAMQKLHAKRGQTVVVTLGAAGAEAIHEGRLISVPSPTIVPVDTVGAGDTFCGYLAGGLDQGRHIHSALKLAAIAGALACTRHGAQEAVPDMRQIEDYLPNSDAGQATT